ncbi:MAG TPA: cytochrome d ubiquinol oxidase subunit II [Rhizomicrobium sp.]|nr:cytochrome d ubiquinol oxidase subunit II [Rhizomicrobium sp.]
MSYETLRIIWWLLIGVLLGFFAVMDGFDLGTAVLLPFIAKNDMERRVVINTVGPVWEGNQVWFIIGGGAIFAAWPLLYAASFSGFYLAMILVLFTLILRAAGFKFRSKIEAQNWRNTWDWLLFVGGLVPALVFGVAFGNLFEGVPFGFDDSLRMQSDITLIGLLNPFALLVGLVSLAMMVLRGACWLNLKTDEPIRRRAQSVVPLAALAFIVLFALAGFWVSQIPAFAITSPIMPDAQPNPLGKTVSHVGSWFANYNTHAVLWILPLLAVAGAFCAALLRRWPALSLWASAAAPAASIATAGAALFPFLMPSSSSPGASLTVWDASSSKLTLGIMFAAAVVFVPIIVAYMAWAYHVLRGPVTAEQIERDSGEAY